MIKILQLPDKMEIVVIQYGEDVASKVEEELKNRIETAQVKTINSTDPFNALAQAKSHLDKGRDVMMFIETEEDKPGQNTGFYNGLSYLQVETGKKIYKEIYLDTEEPEIEGTVEKMVEAVL